MIVEVAIHLGRSDEELKHPIFPPMCPHLLLYENRIHFPDIIIIHTLSVTILVRTDLRVEKLGYGTGVGVRYRGRGEGDTCGVLPMSSDFSGLSGGGVPDEVPYSGKAL